MGAVNVFSPRQSTSVSGQPTQPTQPLASPSQPARTAFGFPSLEDIVKQYQSSQQPSAPAPSTPQPSAPSGPSAFSGQGSFQDWFMQAINGKPFNQQTLLDLEPLLQQSGSQLTPANSLGERTKIWDPTRNDWVRVGFGEGTPQWIYQGWGVNGPQAAQGAQGGAGGVFSDPATQQWEQLLRTLNERLQAPQPTYTDAQRDLMQTQAIDPLERQRQARKQQTIERLGARGIQGGSGILEQALQDVDRQFDQLRTGQQSQFALNQIQREDQLFNSNEQRALAGLNLFSQIPQYADKRLQMAQGVLTPSNPYQLLTLQNQIAQQQYGNQQYQQGQDQQFWQWLGQILANSLAGR